MMDKDYDRLTNNFDEMITTSDLVMWLETHRDTDEICNKMYWDMEYVCKKWVKEMMGVTKEQVQWYFEETFDDYWETIADFLNSKTETKAIMIKDIQEQTEGRHINDTEK